MTVTGFTYAGNVALTTAAGTLVAMEFTVTRAGLAGLVLSTPCRNNVIWSIGTPAADVTTAASGMTLYATEFVGTTPSGPVDWTPVAGTNSTVPPIDPLSGGAGIIGSPTITLAALSMPTLSMPNSSVAASAC
jgi:hypothetical protein